MTKKLLVLAALAAAVPPSSRAAEAFWNGPDITADIGEDAATELDELLRSTVVPKLLASYMTYPARHAYPPGVSVYDARRAWNGYTILTSLPGNEDGDRAILIDMYGNVVRTWPVQGFPIKFLPGGYVMGGYTGNVNVGPTLATLVQLDWCGEEVWRYEGVPRGQTPPPGGARWHHDYQREGSPVGYYAPNQYPCPDAGAKTLLLASYEPDPAATTHISGFPLFDDAFYVIDWDGNVLWEWHIWEHFEELGFDQKAKDAIRTVFVPGGRPPATDWTHSNTVNWVGNNRWYWSGDCRFTPDFILWDSRSMNLHAIVATHDCEPGCALQCKEGDVVWRLGPDYSETSPDRAIGQIIGPHMVHMIPDSLPGGGNILVFDNGGFGGYGSLVQGLPGTWPSQFRTYSRVVELNPVTKRIVWEYKVPNPGPGEKPFFSTLISGAQRLRNGNTLITEGGNGRVFEVTVDGAIVWEYVSPFQGAFGGGGGFIGKNGVYRAYRVPEWWLPPRQYRDMCPAGG